jgi:hypothetical protein
MLSQFLIQKYNFLRFFDFILILLYILIYICDFGLIFKFLNFRLMILF